MKWKPWGNSSEAPITVAAGKLNFWNEEGKDDSKVHPRILEVPRPAAVKISDLYVWLVNMNQDFAPRPKRFPQDS